MAMSNRAVAAALMAVTVMAAAAQDVSYYRDDVPQESESLYGYSIENQIAKLEGLPIQGIEGIWEYPDEMMTVAIERFTSTNFAPNITHRVVMLECTDDDLLPGTVIGYVSPSADSSKYELWIYSEQEGTTLLTPVRCVATLKDGMLTFKRMKNLKVRTRVNLNRFLPTLFRGISVYPQITTEELPVGFRKIYPTDEGIWSPGDTIRYL